MKKFLQQLFCRHIWRTNKIDDLGSVRTQFHYNTFGDITHTYNYKKILRTVECVKCGRIELQRDEQLV